MGVSKSGRHTKPDAKIEYWHGATTDYLTLNSIGTAVWRYWAVLAPANR